MESKTQHTPTLTKKPVILQVLPSLKSGGVERGTIEIAEALKLRDYTPLVASAGGAMVNQLKRRDIEHITLPLATKNPWGIARNIRKLEEIIRDRKVDIVHARSRAPAWSSYLACKKTDCAFVTTFHGVYSLGGKLKQKYNAVMTKGHRVIAASQFIYDHILQHYDMDEDRLRLIARGVDTQAFSIQSITPSRTIELAKKLGVNHRQPLILLPGRLTDWKGHEVLIEALSLVKNDHYQCLLVGDDKHHHHYKKRLLDKIKHTSIKGSIAIRRHVSDMPALYGLASIVVSASTRPEAFGRVAIEAQSMERLVIATNHGGSTETIIDGKTGWLVEPDNPKALADALEEALHFNEVQRHKMTKAAAKHMDEHFTLQQMIDKTLAVYDELV